MGHAIHTSSTPSEGIWTTSRLPLYFRHAALDGSTKHQAPGIVMVYDPLPFLARMVGACMYMQAGRVRVCLPYVVLVLVLVWVWVEGWER